MEKVQEQVARFRIRNEMGIRKYWEKRVCELCEEEEMCENVWGEMYRLEDGKVG